MILAWPIVALVGLVFLWLEGRRYLDLRRAELEQRKKDATVADKFAELEQQVKRYREEQQGLKGILAMSKGRP